jgi:ParB/RepB/Spo0J family partition protein
MKIVEVAPGESDESALARSNAVAGKSPLAGKSSKELVADARVTAGAAAEAFKAKMAGLKPPTPAPFAYPASTKKRATDAKPEKPKSAATEAAEILASASAEGQTEAQAPAPAGDPHLVHPDSTARSPMDHTGTLTVVRMDEVVDGSNVRKVLGDLTELAESIGAVGMLQAPLARTIGNGNVEVVAGFRRVAAARLAGLKEITVNLRALTDAQVLEIQLIENLQRVGLDPLDEAEGFERLQTEFGYTTQQIAEQVGKSVRWVQTHRQLTKLCPEGRKALSKGELSVEVACRIATIPSEKLQVQATEKVTAESGLDKERMGTRAARAYLTENFTTELRGAPFPTKDAFLVPEAGACNACPKRSGSNPDLLGDFHSRADICTDIVCFKEKKEAAWNIQQEKAKNAGKQTVGLAEGGRIFKNGIPSHDSAYVDLAAPCPEDPKKRTWGDVLGEKALVAPEGERGPVIVAPDTDGHAHELLKKDDALRIAKENGLKWASRAAELEEARTPGTKEEQAAKEREERLHAAVESAAIREAVKWVEKNGAAPAVLRMVAMGLAQTHQPDVLERRQLKTDRDLQGLIEATSKVNTLLGLIFEMACGQWLSGFGEFSVEMKAMAKALKISLPDIEKTVRASFEADALFDQKASKKGGA